MHSQIHTHKHIHTHINIHVYETNISTKNSMNKNVFSCYKIAISIVRGQQTVECKLNFKYQQENISLKI